MADGEIKQEEVDELKTKAKTTSRKLREHDTQITNLQALTTLGFIIALITLAGVVIASIVFVTDQVHQSNQQTQLLQQINDKVK